MRIVLLSGGSGQRLWPMSNDSRSKQFLKVLSDAGGQSVSMLQRVWQQLERVGLQSQSYICASKAQYEMIENQLGQVPFIEEPARRDTFPAIALSVAYLQSVAQCTDDEVIVVMPVDPYVDDDFFNSIACLEGVLDDSQADVALVGVTPTHPSSKFGYIAVSSSEISGTQSWRQVDAFIEKPAADYAQVLIGEGALWNCGIFCFRAGFIKRLLSNRGYQTTYNGLSAAFSMLPKRSFDYEVVERTRNIVSVPYTGMWDDLGSWDALSRQITDDFIGLGQAVHCEGTHVINEMGIPVVVAGLRNAMVVSTPDGILVADKQHAAGIKEITATFNGRPMYEERNWGTHRVLDYQKLQDGSEVLTKMITLFPGKNLSYQMHRNRTEVWTVVHGYGEVIIDAKQAAVTAGDVIRIYPEQWHALRAVGELKLIEVQRGPELVEEDIIRRFSAWDEIIEHCAIVMV